MKKIRCHNWGESQFGWGCTHPDHARKEELKLCAGMTDNCYKKRETNWDVMTDKDGYIWGIAFMGQCFLHLKPHTEINVKYVDKFVAMLNKKQCSIKL